MIKAERQFIQLVWDYYTVHGRHSLPWRTTQNPYRILVSEIMLQQTQVERVIPKYQAFLKQWSTVEKLAAAKLGEVLIVWQGLGYNRRAKMLHACARLVVHGYNGQWPKTYKELLDLPGVGPYTAAAMMAFAYNSLIPLIETNVRTVYIHHFYQDGVRVSDQELLPLIERTMDTANPRVWYAALMDYGSHLKSTVGNKSKASSSYIKQAPFKGSDRQIRGAIVRRLSQSPGSVTRAVLEADLVPPDSLRITAQLDKLLAEGLVVAVGRKYSLPT